MKRRMILMLCLSLLLGTAGFGAAATALPTTIKFKVTCKPALPDGTVVLVSIGGDNCNCPHPAVSATASGGAASVSISLGECVPNEHCFAYAAASFGDPSKVYRGRQSITVGVVNEIKMTERKATP